MKPKYKDVEQKILEATRQATLKIIIEEVPVSYQNNLLCYSTTTFYHCLINLLYKKIASNGLVAFYSPQEAQRQSINNPDFSIQIEIEDFEIESWNIKVGYSKPHFTQFYEDKGYRSYTADLQSARKPGHLLNNSGSSTPNQISSQLLMSARSVLKINSLYENKVAFKKKIPWHYTEDLNQPVSPEIGQSYLSENPDYQLYFDHFALSMVDKTVLLIADFFNRSN